MGSIRAVKATLATRVLVRLGWTAFAVLAANVVYALSHNLFDSDHLAENIVRGETRRIAMRVDANLGRDNGNEEPSSAPDDAVSFRVIDATKSILAEQNGAFVERASTLATQDLYSALFHVSRISVDGRDYIWGVARQRIAGRDALVEIALPSALQGAHWRAVGDELSLHVWVPILPSALAFLLLAHWCVHSGLAPLSRAATTIRGAEVARGRAPMLAAERLTSEIGAFLFEVEAAFSRHASLLRAQQEFVGRVAHELRTPLGHMLRDLAAVDDAKARAIERNVRQLNDKIGKMLAWARLDLAPQAQQHAIDLAAIAEAAAADLVGLSAERNIAVLCQRQGEAMTCGDGSAIRDAVRNMVENAIKHTPTGSRVTVTCGPGPRICVADNGGGFPKVDSVLLLQPFWKGDASTDGAGLGLALVKRIADSHGARVILGSSAEGGAEISLRFPLPETLAS